MSAGDGRKQVFYTLDALRGAAAILVVTRHAHPYFGLEPFHYTYLAVDLFFLMSGFVLEQAYGDRLDGGMSPARFTWLRVVRLYPLYLASFVAALAAYALDRGATPAMAQIGAPALAIALGALMLPLLVGSASLYPFNGPAWTLASEFVVNVVYAAVHRSLSGRVIALVCAVSGLMMCALALVAERGLDYGWSPKSVPFALPRVAFSFFLGVALYRRFRARHVAGAVRTAGVRADDIRRSGRRTSDVRTSDPGACLVVAAAVGAMMLPAHVLPHNAYDLVVVGLVFPGAVYAGAILNPSRRLVGIFRLAGLTSYAIYVFHEPLSALAATLLHRVLGVDIAVPQPLAGLVFLPALVLFCWVVDAVYDAPVRRRLVNVRWLQRRTA